MGMARFAREDQCAETGDRPDRKIDVKGPAPVVVRRSASRRGWDRRSVSVRSRRRIWPVHGHVAASPAPPHLPGIRPAGRLGDLPKIDGIISKANRLHRVFRQQPPSSGFRDRPRMGANLVNVAITVPLFCTRLGPLVRNSDARAMHISLGELLGDFRAMVWSGLSSSLILLGATPPPQGAHVAPSDR